MTKKLHEAIQIVWLRENHSGEFLKMGNSCSTGGSVGSSSSGAMVAAPSSGANFSCRGVLTKYYNEAVSASDRLNDVGNIFVMVEKKGKEMFVQVHETINQVEQAADKGGKAMLDSIAEAEKKVTTHADNGSKLLSPFIHCAL